MQAIELHGRDVRLVERPLPEPKPGEVRVRVKACGANGSDWEFATGRPFYGWLARRLMRVRVPGSDVAGVVDKVGPGVGGIAVGDRVMGDVFESFGGFAEYCVAKADRWLPIPSDMGFDEAASLPQSGAIAVTAFDDLAPGAKVLVNGGGGGTGPYAIQMAKARGAEVWAVDNAAKQDVMHRTGADHCLDYARMDFVEIGQRFDRILDLVGTRPPRRIRGALAAGGQYRLVGGPVGLMLAFALRGDILIVKQGPELTARVLDRVRDGSLTPQIGQAVPLHDGCQALRDMGAGRVAGKLVLTA